jgi:hypothetical protein
MASPTHKVVDGEMIELTAEEVAEIEAERAANAALLDPVPESVTNFQGRAMLIRAGLFDAVQAAINSIGEDTQRAIAQEAFERAPFHRKSPLLLAVNAALPQPKTDAELDQLFRDGSEIAV